MAMKRRRASGRRIRGRFMKRKRVGTKRRIRASRSTRKGVFLRVKRRMFVGRVTPSTVATVNWWNYVTPTLASAGSIFGTALSGLSNYDEYKALFDLYKLHGIRYEFKPSQIDMSTDQLVYASSTTLTRAYVDVILDPTDQTSPSGLLDQTGYNAFQEIGNPKQYRGDKNFSFYLRPKVAEQYGGGYDRFIRPQWTDIDGSAMPHRGFHIFWHGQNFNTSNNFAFDVYATYYISFKGKK